LANHRKALFQGFPARPEWFNTGYLPKFPILIRNYLRMIQSYPRLIHHLRFQRSPYPMEWSLACPMEWSLACPILVVE
jgi:hypothetical protein